MLQSHTQTDNLYGRIWNEFITLWSQSRDEPLWQDNKTFRSHKRQEISWRDGQLLLASHERLCCMELVTATVTYQVLFAIFTNWYISSYTTKFWVTPVGNPKPQWSAKLPLVKQILNTHYKRDSHWCNLHSKPGVLFPHVWASNLRCDDNVNIRTLKKNKVTACLM